MKLSIILACFLGSLSFVATANLEQTRQDNFEWFNKKFSKSPAGRQNNCQNCQCGVVNTYVEDRIVDGDESQPYKYPWMVKININSDNSHRGCGASLINDRYVLTAAHCVVADKDDYLLTILQHDRTYLSEFSKVVYVAEMIVHESYNKQTLDNDIALMKLNESLNLSPDPNKPVTLRPLCLPSSTSTLTVGQNGIAAGWGFVSQTGPTSQVLQEVELPVVSDDACRNLNDAFTTNMFCAGSDDKYASICYGDSGGPYFQFDEGTGSYTQMGVSSWIDRCGQEGKYSGFAKVANYVDWIHEKTSDACYCPRPSYKN